MPFQRKRHHSIESLDDGTCVELTVSINDSYPFFYNPRSKCNHVLDLNDTYINIMKLSRSSSDFEEFT